MEFKDKVVVVTGGTRGIGRAVSLRFAREGAWVFAAYLKNDEAAQALIAEAEGASGSIVTIKADVRQSDQAMALMEAAAKPTGHLDILVNNAGVVRDVYLAMMSEADWDDVIKGNLYPLYHCCKWGSRKMIGRRSGAIINLSSVSAFLGTVGQTNYAATKGGAISFTRALARELGPMGIRVNAVAPGLIDTDITSVMKPEARENVIKTTSLGRIGLPDEVAEAVLFLASRRASYITGQCMVVDGGIL